MPQAMNLNALMQVVKLMTLEEQRKLNKLLVANIRGAQKVKAVTAAMDYEVGQVVKFDGKTRGPIYIKITGFSRDMTKVKGVQINQGWKTSPGMPWTAPASFVKPTTPTEVELVKA
jgi:hypothetical protein